MPQSSPRLCGMHSPFLWTTARPIPAVPRPGDDPPARLQNAYAFHRRQGPTKSRAGGGCGVACSPSASATGVQFDWRVNVPVHDFFLGGGWPVFVEVWIQGSPAQVQTAIAALRREGIPWAEGAKVIIDHLG